MVKSCGDQCIDRRCFEHHCLLCFCGLKGSDILPAASYDFITVPEALNAQQNDSMKAVMVFSDFNFYYLCGFKTTGKYLV